MDELSMRSHEGRALQTSQERMALCGLGSNYRRKMGVLSLLQLCAISLISIYLAQPSQAFTQVYISTGAPIGLEKSFLASTTAQFNGAVIPNPLVSNTYTLKLYGLNPSYQAPPSTLKQALDLGATVYAYGWVDGQAYERNSNLRTIGYYIVNLGTSDVQCTQYLGLMENDIYTQNFSTPTVIPGGGF